MDKTLGIGSYGQVCKAKYGRLPCAAKVLHPTLFQFGMGSDSNYGYITKFQQECESLSTLKHPNIVQHLGTTKDPATGRPVLLVELLDQSLTCYLKESHSPPPYYIQVNISNDVALALSYLHLNGIIHRDLSSNNVLLLGRGGRAKVTDFGLYKLIDTNLCVSPLAHTQGTLAYMPPEVLIIPPNYSSQMDCFSLGVLIVQIITRNFPDPGDAHKIIDDPSHSTGRVVVQIPELERRKRDIDAIESDHLLLSVATNCLHDRSTERPSANELCEKLAELKTQEEYTASAEGCGDQSTTIQKLKEELEAKEQLISEANAQMQKKAEEHEREKKALNEELAKANQVLDKCRLSFQQSKDAKRKELQAEMQMKAEKHTTEMDKMKKELAAMKQQIEDQHSHAKRNEAVIRKEFLMEMETKDAEHEEEKEALKNELAKIKQSMEEYKLQLEKKEEAERKLKEESRIAVSTSVAEDSTTICSLASAVESSPQKHTAPEDMLETNDASPPQQDDKSVDTNNTSLQQEYKSADDNSLPQDNKPVETDNTSLVHQDNKTMEALESSNESLQQEDMSAETLESNDTSTPPEDNTQETNIVSIPKDANKSMDMLETDMDNTTLETDATYDNKPVEIQDTDNTSQTETLNTNNAQPTDNDSSPPTEASETPEAGNIPPPQKADSSTPPPTAAVESTPQQADSNTPPPTEAMETTSPRQADSNTPPSPTETSEVADDSASSKPVEPPSSIKENVYTNEAECTSKQESTESLESTADSEHVTPMEIVKETTEQGPANEPVSIHALK